MIESIYISDFKRIDQDGIELEELAVVNYLIGENNCGKSSVLEALQYLYIYQPKDRKILIKLSDDDSENVFKPIIIRCDGLFDLSDKNNVHIEPFHEKHILKRVKTKGEVYLSELAYFNQNNQPLETQKLLRFLRYLLKNQALGVDETDEILGESILSKLALGVLYLAKNYNFNQFLIEEPENHLHPKWQKKLAYLFDYLGKEFNIQFIISTHSPFLISSSSQLTQEIKDKLDLKDGNFKPPQKVYFLKDGKIASKRGEIETDASGHLKGRFGYWGSKVIYISSKMLGAGLMDLISPQMAFSSHDAPQIIFCEGEGDDEDARLYNIIFKDLTPPVLFISSRGSSQLYRTFSVIKEIKKGLAANFSLKMLRDRDHEFPTEDSIEKYEKENRGCKVLRRRAIECYLYNSETAVLWLKKRHLKPNPKLLNEMDNLHVQIQKEAETGILGNDYKERLRDLFLQIIFDKVPVNFVIDQDFKEDISALITPETQIYQELFWVLWRKAE